LAAAFAFGGGLSTVALAQVPDVTAALAGIYTITRNGVEDMTRVAGVPANGNEWRLNAGNLEIGADITGTLNTYRVVYPRV